MPGSSDNAVAATRCFVEVYPYEGGKYVVSGNSAAFLQLSTSKHIVNGGNGQFTLNLAPGGPYGVNARPTWMDIFTPFSLVVIAMQRGSHAAIVMVGLVVSAEETQTRNTNSVQRMIRVNGEDFTRMFTSYNYYNLNLQIGIPQGPLGYFGLPSSIGAALQGTPANVGIAWYNQVMNAPSMMGPTSFAYKGQRPTFFDLMATWFEPYPANIDIPTIAPFLADEGTWLTKFQSFFPFPWYEFFIQTAPVGYYATTTPSTTGGNVTVTQTGPDELSITDNITATRTNATNAGTPITMNNYAPVSPTLVARVNPLPFLSASGLAGSPTFSINLDRWYALPTFGMDGGHGTISQSLGYSDVEVRNYYVFAPTWLATTYGQANGSITPFQLLFSAWIDQASIHRYGYRPNNSELRWMADKGIFAQSLAAAGKGFTDFQILVGDLSLRPVAYYEPTPNMLHGAVRIELRPDILPGNTFTFVPYRDGVKWTFYIEGVSHNIPFGGAASTELTLTRGLIAENYYNKPLLVALHTGNAQRINGTLSAGVPPGIGSGLAPVNLDTVQGLIFGLSQQFGSPSGYNAGSGP